MPTFIFQPKLRTETLLQKMLLSFHKILSNYLTPEFTFYYPKIKIKTSYNKKRKIFNHFHLFLIKPKKLCNLLFYKSHPKYNNKFLFLNLSKINAFKKTWMLTLFFNILLSTLIHKIILILTNICTKSQISLHLKILIKILPLMMKISTLKKFIL